MMRTLLLTLWLSMVSLAHSDQMDLIAPLITTRLNEVTSKLPVPKEVLNMVIYQMGSYFFLTDSKSETCHKHSDLLFNAFLKNDVWALKMFDANSKIGSGLMDGNIQDLGSYDQCVSVEAPSGLFQGQHCVVETRGLLPEYLMDPMNIELEGNCQLIGGVGLEGLSTFVTWFKEEMEKVLGLKPLPSWIQKTLVMQPEGLFALWSQNHLQWGTPWQCFSEVKKEALRMDFLFSLCVPSSCTPKDVKDHFDAAWESINASAILFNSSCSTANVTPLEIQELLTIWILLIFCSLVLLSTVYDYFVEDKDRNQLLSSFSLSRNILQLIASENNPDSLPCIYGLRVIALAWIVLAHRLAMEISVPKTSFRGVSDNINSLWWAPIQEVQVAVEIFFLISGLLMSYNFIKGQLKGVKFNYFSFIFRRYKRLTPLLAVVVLITAAIASRLTDGPLWSRSITYYQESCQNKWWANLLYINNYYNRLEMCVPPSWYLAADFQMHIIGPILLIGILKSKILGVMSILLCLTSTISSTFVFTSTNKMPAMGIINVKPMDPEKYHGLIQATHHRAGSFLIGMILGYYIYRIKHENVIVKLNKVTLVIGWILSAALILAPFYLVTLPIVADMEFDPWFDPAYSALHGPLVSVGVSWIIFVCTLGHGGCVNKVLSWRALVPLSRLSYGAFLVHMLMQQVLIFSTRTNVYIDASTPWLCFPLDFLLSNILSAALYVTVEAPFSNLLFKRRKS